MGVYGESEHQIDDNGRINIPRRFQALFEHGGFLTRALNSLSLVYYTHAAWQEIQDRLNAVDFSEQAADDVARYFSIGTEVRLDGQGRLTIPPNLRRRANLDKDLTLLAIGNRLEIWNSAAWQAYDNERLTPGNLGQALSALNPRRAG